MLSSPATGGLVAFDATAPAYLAMAGNDLAFGTPPQLDGEPVVAPLGTRCSLCHGPGPGVGHLMTFSRSAPLGQPFRQLTGLSALRTCTQATWPGERWSWRNSRYSDSTGSNLPARDLQRVIPARSLRSLWLAWPRQMLCHSRPLTRPIRRTPCAGANRNGMRQQWGHRSCPLADEPMLDRLRHAWLSATAWH
jgi:hypothetical protein